MFILVISLGGNVLAAQTPIVATLEPITDGLRMPLKMALDSNGDIYVADPRSGGVVVLNQYGVMVKVLQTPRSISSVALLNNNNAIATGAKVLVALGDYVAVLDQDGNEVARLGSGSGQFIMTSGMAVAPDGTIYVADSGSYNVNIFGLDGKYIKSFGSYGTAGGQFTFPGTVAVITETSGTRIAVADTAGGKVDIFNPDGSYQQTVGSPIGYGGAGGALQFVYPSGITFDYANGVLNRMYIVDMFQGNIQVIDPAATGVNQLLEYIGTYGSGSGNLMTPSDIQFDTVNKRLLVANGVGNIATFGIDNGQNPIYAVPPVLTIDQPAVAVAVPSALLTGTVDPGCALTASANTSAQVATASFPSATSWMIAVDGLTPGNNIISITAKNSYGTTITKTASVRYTPPTTGLSVNSTPALTSQSSFALSGTVDSGSTVYVANTANGVSGQASVDSNGLWTYTVSLVEGINNLDITGVRSGATAAFSGITVQLDTQAPILTVSSLPDGSTVTAQVQNISGTALDPNLAGVTVNGNPVAVNNSTFSYALSLVKGANVITVTASDSLGHSSTDVRTLTFNPNLPVITIAAPADGIFTNQKSITISGSIDLPAAVTVNGMAANPDGGLNWNSSLDLVSGMNTIEIAATDPFGSVVKQKRTIIYDTVAPDVAISSPSQDSAINAPGLTISGSITATIEIQSIRATVNGVDKQVTLTNGNFSFFADFTSEGTYVVAVSVTDVANNVSTAMRTIVYDITPPSLTVDPVKVPYPFTLTGTVEAGASLVVKDAAGVSGKVTVNGDKWSADLSGLNYDAETLIAQATDAAGNVSVCRINTPVPDGDVDGDGKVTINDALTVLQIVIHNQKPTQQQLAHGDIGPLLDGKANPKGSLEIVDAILILRKALGLQSWQ